MELAKQPIDQTQTIHVDSSLDTSFLCLVFRIGQQQYSLPVSSVIEIVPLPALVTLAGAPTVIIGLLNLRGKYLPVLDGNILVDEPPTYRLSDQIVIAGHIKASSMIPLFGLKVDHVIDVRTIHQQHITPIHKNIAAPFLTGIVRSSGESILMFDIHALIDLVPEEASLVPDYDRS